MDSVHLVRIAEQFPPAQGGLAPGMLALSLEQHHRGYQVTVITRDAEGARDVDSLLPFRVVRVPARSLTHLGWQAVALLRDLYTDVVHCHGPAAAPILFRKRKEDPPVVLTLHAVRRYQFGLFRHLDQLVESFAHFTGSPVCNSPRLYHSWLPRIVWALMLERYMCQKADHLALVAAYFRQQVAEYYGIPFDRCTVIYNGSDFHRQTSRDTRGVKTSLGFGRDAKIILYVGRLDWVKRAHLLVQALPRVLEREKRARLLLVGDGDQRRDLGFLIAKLGLECRASVLDWTQHEKLQGIYSCAACLCLPSIWEGLSKVMLEAMGMGVPVLASDIPANRELLQDGKAGFLVEKPDPASWALALCEVLSNTDEVNARTQQAAKLVDDRYRWIHVAERLEGVYKQLIGPHLQGQELRNMLLGSESG